MTSVTISKKWLETCGHASLEGLLFEAGIVSPQEVTLRFEREPLTTDGPAVLLIPDFAPVRLIESILHLCKQGYRVKVEERFPDSQGK